MSLKEILSERRPTLSKSSLTTYNSILTNLYKKIFGGTHTSSVAGGNEGEIHLKNFEETDKVIHFIKDISPNKRKTILSALVVLTDNKKYRELMLEDISSYNKDMSHQEKSETQKENWLSEEEINATYDRLKKEADYLYKKPNLTMGDLQIIQDYIILCLLGGKYIPVRRSLDYVNMKKSGQLVKDKDNYIDWKKNVMIFNIFKTAKFYGKQELPLPSDLKRILNKWAKQAPHTDYLLFDNNSNPLTSVKLNQRFQKIFGKKSSTNALRHTYLTKLYGHHIEGKKQMEKTATDMGTSSDMITGVYIKK